VLLGRLERLIRRALERELRGEGVTVAQYNAMAWLAAEPELSSAELARRTGTSPQAINQIISTLDENGLLIRTTDERNPRIQHLRLSERAVELLVRCDEIVGAAEADVLRTLSTQDRLRLSAMLSSVGDDALDWGA
jgi:DNA-binding MarR family transcriptional regulator